VVFKDTRGDVMFEPVRDTAQLPGALYKFGKAGEVIRDRLRSSERDFRLRRRYDSDS
jgi:hypothetical protein